MKKLFMMVVFALTTLTMSAQEDSKFMVKAGLGISNLVGSQTDGDKARIASYSAWEKKRFAMRKILVRGLLHS